MYRLMMRCRLPCPYSSGRSLCRLFALRYSLSNVLVSPPSAVAAAQLAPIASCADVKRPEIVPVIPPLDLRGSWGLLLLLLFGLCLLDPVGDILFLLGLGRLADLLDVLVLWSRVSTSVTSSNLSSMLVCPCGGVHVLGLCSLHPVCGLTGLPFTYQPGSSKVVVSACVGEHHHVAAPWEGQMLTGHVVLQLSEVCPASLEYASSLRVTPSSPMELLRFGTSSNFRSYFSICFSILSSWRLCQRASSCPGHLQYWRGFHHTKRIRAHTRTIQNQWILLSP